MYIDVDSMSPIAEVKPTVAILLNKRVSPGRSPYTRNTVLLRGGMLLTYIWGQEAENYINRSTACGQTYRDNNGKFFVEYRGGGESRWGIKNCGA